MFKGIIQEVGEICFIHGDQKGLTLTVQTSGFQKNSKIGDSIAIDGTCYTLVSLNKKTLSVSAGPETIKRTIISAYKKGTKVNLELPLQLTDRIDGHFVQGHIDSIGKVTKVIGKNASKYLTISFNRQIAKYLAFKGSIAVNGVSLTVSHLQKTNFTVCLIPHTLKTTNLDLLNVESSVNIEVDIFARYIERMLQEKEKTAKYEWLAERNFI